jgi:hypothetical protein
VWDVDPRPGSVGLTGGEDGGGGGRACSAGSTAASPASLKKRRSGGTPLRAAMVPDLSGVVTEAWPLASGRLVVVAGPFTLRAEHGGPSGGEDRDLLRRWPATSEEERGASMWTSTGSLAGDARTTPVGGGDYSSRGKEHKTTNT